MNASPPMTAEAPLLVDATGAARLCGISRSTFLRLDARGQIGPMSVRLGRRRLWSREALGAWIGAGCPPRCAWLARKGGG